MTGDVNGDGKLDLAVSNYGGADVSILRGDGDGRFAGPTNYLLDAKPISLASGDFNGDGKPDLALVSDTGNTISVLLENGCL